ncbi:MAG: hypothetical protein IJ514_00840 [Clostridia bacterium]|nr:hypothetical protein [Clostridia bacterium]
MEKPQSLEIRRLCGDLYEIAATEDVEAVEIANEETEEKHTEYTYTERRDTARLSGYEEAVSALIGLKYTTGDEIALTRKGITASNDAEYVAYLAHVEECKAYARAYFDVEGGAV